MLALSWGLGLQSTTLLEMSLSGDLPKLDVAIFADTGFEHQYSYEIFDFYAPRAKQAGIEVVKIGGQDIFGDNMKHVTLPLYVTGNGQRGRMIKRKCTRDYKIRPIQRQLRDILGVSRRGRLRADLVTLWLGITIDEIERAKPSRVAFINHQFPLLEMDYWRGDCAEYLQRRGLPVPGKSSCVFCPYKKPAEWANLKHNQPQTFNLVADLEQHINDRHLVKIGGQPKTVTFLRSGTLPQADFKSARADLSDLCDGGFCHA